MVENTTLGVIYGGKSSEHEVSLRTAFSIMQAVDYDKFEVVPIYIKLDGTWVIGEQQNRQPESVQDLKLQNKDKTIALFELGKGIDVFFPVVHGPYGEDGKLQGLLAMLDVPYVGSGVLGSALGMDKVMMKKIFESVALPQCKYLSFTRKELALGMTDICTQIEATLGFPCFVKPANLGSSVGISKAKNLESLKEALEFATKFDHKVIIEEFVKGREVEIGVLGNETLKTSVVGEIFTAGEFYDYAAKYKDIGTKLQIPADIPEHVGKEIEKVAKQAFAVLECSGLSRVDFFWDEEADQVYINEINTMPGFTPFSMYPMLFQEAGISYPQLIAELIQLALERYEEEKKKQVDAESLD